MIARLLAMLLMCAFAASADAAPAQSTSKRTKEARRTAEAARVATEFGTRAKAYVELQKKVEGGAQKPTTAAEQIASHQHELAASIAAARADARQGDLFTSDVVAELSRVIRQELRGKDGRRIRRTILEGDPVERRALKVNDVYPEDIPVTTMPPMILRRLPPLPMELAYRIVGNDLMLQDLKTNLIIDFISGAIPPLK